MTRATWAAMPLSVLAVWLPVLSQAAEPTVGLTLDVVEASNEGEVVDPALAPMKEKFAQSGISYRSYRKLASQNATLTRGKALDLKLPNGKSASVRLEEMRGKKALVRVTVPPVETVYELGREGSVFVRAGRNGGGVLILVLTPAPGG